MGYSAYAKGFIRARKLDTDGLREAYNGAKKFSVRSVEIDVAEDLFVPGILLRMFNIGDWTIDRDDSMEAIAGGEYCVYTVEGYGRFDQDLVIEGLTAINRITVAGSIEFAGEDDTLWKFGFDPLSKCWKWYGGEIIYDDFGQKCGECSCAYNFCSSRCRAHLVDIGLAVTNNTEKAAKGEEPFMCSAYVPKSVITNDLLSAAREIVKCLDPEAKEKGE